MFNFHPRYCLLKENVLCEIKKKEGLEKEKEWKKCRKKGGRDRGKEEQREEWGGTGGEFELQAVLHQAALLHTGLDPCASPVRLCDCRLSSG